MAFHTIDFSERLHWPFHARLSQNSFKTSHRSHWPVDRSMLTWCDGAVLLSCLAVLVTLLRWPRHALRLPPLLRRGAPPPLESLARAARAHRWGGSSAVQVADSRRESVWGQIEPGQRFECYIVESVVRRPQDYR